MKKLLHVVLLPLLVVAACTSSALCADLKGKFGLGLNYPGAGIRYFFSDRMSLELKGQSETGATVGGLRGYYYFKPEAAYRLFAGLEADYVTFKGDVSEGTGYAAEPFVGGEYFFAKQLSLQMDFGPAFISLADKNLTDISVSGLEFVLNFGVNYYF